MKKTLKRYPYVSATAISLILAIVMAIVTLFISFNIILLLYPSEVTLESGTVERYQAIFQLIISVMIGGTAGLTFFIFLLLKLSRKFSK